MFIAFSFVFVWEPAGDNGMRKMNASVVSGVAWRAGWEPAPKRRKSQDTVRARMRKDVAGDGRAWPLVRGAGRRAAPAQFLPVEIRRKLLV
jgi:hypothetical protein